MSGTPNAQTGQHPRPVDARDGCGDAWVDGGAVVGRILREMRVRHFFCINGGHTFPILAALRENGVQMIHMRHEQACAYAADAYARVTGQVGVCSVTAGCGLTNAVTGLCTAGLAGSAVVCIAGQHPTTEDGLGSFQEAYGSEICRSFSKFTKRVLDWSTIEVDLRMAFREARTWPPGPALIEIPANILYAQGDSARQRRGAQVLPPQDLRPAGDPSQIDRALELLVAAERPLIVAGDGVFWSGAAQALREFAELTAIPVYSRRAGQGALPEDHPLAVRGAWKKPFTGRADVILTLGFRFWSGEHFGQPPTWNAEASYIQVDPCPSRIGWQVPAQVALVADPKLFLQQMTERIRRASLDKPPATRQRWIEEVARVRQQFAAALREQERQAHHCVPIHPARLVRELTETADREAIWIIDSFTLSGWLSQWLEVRYPGQIVDAGPLAPVGHGIGMAIGAQLAHPERQVIVVSGDGGFGIGGMDLETAVRYRLPIVTVLWNNSAWGPSFDQTPMLRGRVDPFDMLPDIRYESMFEVIGCHGEYVGRPDEIRPALERAFASGKTAVVNVLGDKRVGHARLGGSLLGSTQV